MPTMADVAKHANVALSTVSYAINGTRPISEETRQRIFAAMEELGYRPHALARGLASKRSNIIALLFSAPERGLGITELEFVTGAADSAKENGHHLILWTSEFHDPDLLRQQIQQCLVDGVIVMEVRLNDERVALLRETGLPFMMIGRCANTTGIGYVDIDFDQTIHDAVRYLTEMDHSRIAFINHSRTVFDAGYGPAVRTLTSYEHATQMAGIRCHTRFCNDTPTAGYETLNDLLADCPDLTACVVMNERAIPGIMQAVADRDWRIPDDFSILSVVSSARAAEMMMPPLTTMNPPSAEMGRLVAQQLIQQLEATGQEVPQILLPCQLIVRSSTGPCPKHRSE